MTPLPRDRERPTLSAGAQATRLESLGWVLDELSAPDLTLGRAAYLRELLFEQLARSTAGSDTIDPGPVPRRP